MRAVLTYQGSTFHRRSKQRRPPQPPAFPAAMHGFARVFFAVAVPVAAWAGGGPQNALIVVNDNSQDSLELGQYYQEQRGIPESHIVHISTATNDDISVSTFTNDILQPIENHLAQFGLSNQIDFVVYTVGVPYRVIDGTSHNGITSATFYGFKTYPDPATNQCTLPPATFSAYYESETAFHNHAPAGSGTRWISAILTAMNMEIAKDVVNRSVLADYAFTDGKVYYLHTFDKSRNVRWPQFENADFIRRQLGVAVTGILAEGGNITGQTGLIGYMLGSSKASGLFSNDYRLGALADHFTSFGGLLYDDPHPQRSILDWLDAGCVGSYGTVVEPCNITNKFPQARVHAWYSRGFSMGESYTMSLEAPYMGVLAGDPLCAPYADPSLVTVSGIVSNEVVSGLSTVTVTAVSSGTGREVGRIDLFVDDVFVSTLTNSMPLPGDEVTVTIDGDAQSYAVGPGDTLTNIAADLAAAVNAGPQAAVTARASGDRVELIQNALGVMGSNIAYSASISSTVDSTLWVRTSSSSLLETTYPARQEINISGDPFAGTVLTTVITRLDGVKATNSVNQMAGDTLVSLLDRLATSINSNADLQVSTGCEMKYVEDHTTEATSFLVARTNGWNSYNLHVDFTISTHPVLGLDDTEYEGNFASNQGVLSARGTVFLSRGRPTLNAQYVLAPSLLADGPHTLTMVAYEGTAVEAQGRRKVPFVVDNHDLTCEITVPATGNAYLQGQTVDVTAAATASLASVTSVTFYVEGKPLQADTSEPYTCSFDTLSYGIGTVGIQARAEDDGGRSAWSERVDILILHAADEDDDGLPDGWEILHFGDIETYDGDDDPDLDGADNASEFIADTDPDDGLDSFRITEIIPPTNGQHSITFVSQPTREYSVQYYTNNPVATTNFPTITHDWMPSDPDRFPGSPGSTTWIDTNAPAAGNFIRGYRANAYTP